MVEDSGTRLPDSPMHERFSAFLSGAGYFRRGSSFAINVIIIPLPFPTQATLREQESAPLDHQRNCELLREALLAPPSSADSSWMRLQGGRGYDVGSYRADGEARLHFTEYFTAFDNGARPHSVRIYGGLNAIVARAEFRSRDAFSPNWIWMLVRHALEVARSVFAVLSPDAKHTSVAVVLNNATMPMRLVSPFGSKDYYLQPPSNGDLILGDPPLKSLFDRRESAESLIKELRRQLYDRFAMDATA